MCPCCRFFKSDGKKIFRMKNEKAINQAVELSSFLQCLQFAPHFYKSIDCLAAVIRG